MSSSLSVYVGIDPGVSGGIATIIRGEKGEDKWVADATPMPRSDRDAVEILRPNVFKYAVIEKVSSSPQMGVVSAFTFGRGYGKLEMALTALGIPYQEVRPHEWQKGLGIPPRKKTESKAAFKNRLRIVAQQRFPNFPMWSKPKSKGEQLAVCDALLIALYCAEKNGGHHAEDREADREQTIEIPTC